MKRIWVMVAGLIGLAGIGACGEALAGSDSLPSNKVFVCKYEITPGGDERLQTGQNPISVSINALPAGVTPAIGVEFNDAQGRSIVIAFDTGQVPEPSASDCPPPNPPPTTTSSPATTAPTTTVAPTTSGPTTTSPSVSLFSVNVFAICVDNEPVISITFGNRPNLNGDSGILDFSDGTSYGVLVFQSGQTITIPYPASRTTPLTLTYRVMGETATATVTLPADCPPATTTTVATTTTAATTTTQPGVTTTAPTTTVPAVTTTTLPPTFAFGAAVTVCVREVPTIRIVFQNQFPQLAGHVGTLTMADVNGNVVSTQPLVYQPGATVDILYPGTRVNADGSIADVPGWNLVGGFWVRDPSDEFLRDGIRLTYTVNPTATAFVTYPPESSACANPNGPFPPATPPPLPPTL